MFTSQVRARPNKSHSDGYKLFYNIASRATQSNSVYVSVLQISIVLADGVSKIFVFARAAIVSVGRVLYFAAIMDTNRDSAHQSQNEDKSQTFSLGLEFLNEAE